MKPSGSSYKVVAVFNPLNKLPSRVYPIFQQSGETGATGHLFQQVLNEEGKIENFLKIGKSHADSLIGVDDNRVSFFGQSGIHCFAHSEKHILIVRGLSKFRGYFQEFMTEDRYRELKENPFCAVELARFIGNDEYERRYTRIATRELAKKNVNVAEGWLNYSPLSTSAREAGLRVLTKYKADHGIAEPIEDLRSIQLSESTFFQGDFVRVLWDGKIHIRIGKKVYRGKPV